MTRFGRDQPPVAGFVLALVARPVQFVGDMTSTPRILPILLLFAAACAGAPRAPGGAAPAPAAPARAVPAPAASSAPAAPDATSCRAAARHVVDIVTREAVHSFFATDAASQLGVADTPENRAQARATMERRNDEQLRPALTQRCRTGWTAGKLACVEAAATAVELKHCLNPA